MYPLVFFDALRVKIRDEGLVRNKAVYVALGVTPEGTKDILGLWIETSEGAKFWLRVMNELKNRGVDDILIAVVDGLKGFPDAINAVFPQTIVQTCIVHLIRNSMDFASWKDRKAIAAELKTIYRAKDADAGREALEAFDAGPWGIKYPAIAQSWRRNWEQVIPFFAFPVAVRRIIYTTNAIESLEREAAPRRANARAFSNRRGRDEIAVSRLASGRGRMENAATRMVRGEDPIRHHVRRKVRRGVMVNLAPHTRFLTVPSKTNNTPIASQSEVEQFGFTLLETLFPLKKGIRLLGVTLSSLGEKPYEEVQLRLSL